MNKFSLVIALCLCLPIVHGEGEVIGNVVWNSTGKALKPDQVTAKYSFDFEITGRGAFSSLRKGTLKSNGEKVSMKLEHPDNDTCYLPLEVHVYETLEKKASKGNLLEKGFANLYDYGSHNEKRALIISQLGLDILDYFEEHGIAYFEWDKVQLLATSTIDELKFLHEAGYIHQDIKPENLMFGVEDPKKVDPKKNPRASFKNRVYLIDLGGATNYQDEKGTCLKQTKRASHTPRTPPYNSRSIQNKLSQCRRDDMEALGFVLLRLAGVMLPWESLSNDKEIIQQQNRLCDDLDVVAICRQSEMINKNVQAAFSTYFYLLKKLFAAKDSFCKEPDYSALKKCFGDDPQAYYLNVTGTSFEETAGLGKILRRAEKKISINDKTQKEPVKQKVKTEDLPKVSESKKKKK